MLLLELHGADVAECGVQAALIVNIVDEPGKLFGEFIEVPERHRIDRFDFERFHEALRVSVVVRVSASAHRADEVMGRQQSLIDTRCVLRSAVGMMNASWSRAPSRDRYLQHGEREPRVYRPADRIADDAA